MFRGQYDHTIDAKGRTSVPARYRDVLAATGERRIVLTSALDPCVAAYTLAEWDAFPNELRYSSLRFTVTRLHDFFLKPAVGAARVDKDFREFFERLRVLRREKEGGMEALLMAMATGYDYRKYQKVKANERLKA